MKKILLIGVIIIVLIAIPLTVFILQQQTQPKSGAAPASTISFSQPPSQVNVGDTFDLVATVNPGGGNQISFIKLNIQYDGTKLSASNLVPVEQATPDKNFITLEPAQVNSSCSNPVCFATITLSIGSNPQNAITAASPVAKITFKALADTGGNTTEIGWGNGTEALSLSGSDQVSQDVLSTKSPVDITIAVLTPTPSPEVTDTPVPTETTGGGGGGGTGGGTDTTPTPTATTSSGNAPTCTSFTPSATSGNAPAAITFTTAGNSDSSTTISKVTFNFGDGTVQDVTSGNGIGTATASGVSQQHTYSSAGTFTANATFTDANGVVSTPSSCQSTITVNAAGSGTLPKTGPSDALMQIGVIGAVVAVAGGFFLFGL